jgi:hypothetical protein
MREGPPTNGMQRTRNEQAFYHQRFVRAADAGRFGRLLELQLKE